MAEIPLRSLASRLPDIIFQYGVKPCAIAGFFVLVALLWTFGLQHEIAYPFVFLFFGAVMGSAWFGGLLAGLVAVALSSLLVTYFFIPPLYSLTVAHESQSFLAAFILCALAIGLVSSARKRAETAIRNARDELELRVQERTEELERSYLEIRESERQLRMLTEAIPQQLWRADGSGSVEYVNQYLRDYVGGDPDLLRGNGLFQSLHPADRLLFQRTWETARESGSACEVEARVSDASKRYRWFLIRVVPHRSDTGSILNWYGIHIDVEEQHRAQQSLQSAHDDLARLLRTFSMAELAASIAHELNQPMTALVTHAYACREWLVARPPNIEKASLTAEKIVQEGTRASLVVRRVRSLYSKGAEVREVTDLNQLIEDLERLMRDEATRQGVTLELELAEAVSPARIDPVQIRQVLVNLVRNSIEALARHEGPRRVTIGTRESGDGEITVAVGDNGPGISPAIAGRIFEPFVTTKPEGTGIGLALCRSILEAHQGRLWTENPAGGGALFQFTVRAER
jgi:PAS domain S-box-containing protein